MRLLLAIDRNEEVLLLLRRQFLEQMDRHREVRIPEEIFDAEAAMLSVNLG